MMRILKQITFLLLVNWSTSEETVEDECTELDDSPINFSIMDRHRRVKREDARNLRVAVLKGYYLEIRDDVDDIMKNIVYPAIANWTKHLQPTYPLMRNLRVKRKCKNGDTKIVDEGDGTKQEYCMFGCEIYAECGKNIIPKHLLSACREMINEKPTKHNDAGVGLFYTDILLVVDVFQSTRCGGSTRAHTIICEIDPVSNRPIVASVNLCPKLFEKKTFDADAVLGTAIHEVGHGLGFAKKVFAFMLDENGQPRTKRDSERNLPILGMSENIYNPSKETVGEYQENYVSATTFAFRTIRGFRTPRLLEEARKYSGCKDLIQVHLENFVPQSHFEKRIYNGDLMVAAGKRRFISHLTLAFFEDSGWYHVNYDGASELTWGKGLGCDFVYKSCYEYQKKHPSSGPWCFEISSQCKVRKYKDPLPKENQYFESLPKVPKERLAYYGGSDKFMDYCPFRTDATSTE